MFICAHCGSIQKTESDIVWEPQTLDTGTTFTCMQCGKDTVVVLMRPEDYRVNTDLLEALKAYQDANRVRNDSEAELYELAEAAIARAEGKAE